MTEGRGQKTDGKYSPFYQIICQVGSIRTSSIEYQETISQKQGA